MRVRRGMPNRGRLPGVTVRRAGEHDRRTVWRWIMAAKGEIGERWPEVPERPEDLRLAGIYVAVNRSKKPLGTVTVDEEPIEIRHGDTGEKSTFGHMVHSGYVPREHRKRGVDRYLLEHITAQQRQFPLISIPINPLARNALKHYGFQDGGKVRGRILNLGDLTVDMKAEEPHNDHLFVREK